MNKKIFISLLLISLLLLTVCSYSYAATNVGNDLKNVRNAAGSALSGAAGAVVDGARDLTNGASNMMNNMTNANGDTESDATNTMGTTNSDYTATRTATGNNNMLGMSDTTWTWLILGIVGAAIIGLVWFYSSQYEHRSYND